MPFWHRFELVPPFLVVPAIVARLIDRRIARRDLPPEAATRYRVLRRSVSTAVISVGLLSALLVIPQVRTVAGSLLASSAVVRIVIGFASQRTIGNFVAGLLIAFTQPIRLGDRVVLENTTGTVEEIALTYTFIRTEEGSRLVIPNEKLASDTIVNATIVSREKVAEISLQVPLDKDLRAAVQALQDVIAGERAPEIAVTSLEGNATIVLRVAAAGAGDPTTSTITSAARRNGGSGFRGDAGGMPHSSPERWWGSPRRSLPPDSAARQPSRRAAASRSFVPCRPGRRAGRPTRSSTPQTGRCSDRFPPRRTGSRLHCPRSARGCRRRRLRSRTNAFTSTEELTTRGSSAQRSRIFAPGSWSRAARRSRSSSFAISTSRGSAPSSGRSRRRAWRSSWRGRGRRTGSSAPT